MDLPEILELFEHLEQNVGWFYDFLSYFVAIGLVLLFLIFIVRLWKGEVNWFGRKKECPSQPNSTPEERAELEQLIEQLQQECKQLNQAVQEKKEEIAEIKKLYIELDQCFADETYTMSQIMYAAEEVATALALREDFYLHKDDIFDHLLDYIINVLKGFREKHPCIVIHVPHSQQEDRLVHYAHSSGFGHQVKQYEPKIYGSAAGRAFRNNEVYYIPNVDDPEVEYERKPFSKKKYKSLLCVPLSAGFDKSTCIGVLSLTGKPVAAYEEIEIERTILFSKILYPLIYMDTKKGASWNGSHSSESKT